MTEAKHTAWHINEARTVEGEMMVCGGEGHGYGLIAAVTMPDDAQSIVRDHNERPSLLARLASLEADLHAEKEESASYHRFWIEQRNKSNQLEADNARLRDELRKVLSGLGEARAALQEQAR